MRSNGVRFSLCRNLFGCLDWVLDVTTGILNVVLLTMDKVFGCFVGSDLLIIVRFEWFLVLLMGGVKIFWNFQGGGGFLRPL